MSEPTKSVAVRFPTEIAEEIQAIAKANGQNTSEWIRDQIMPIVHATEPVVQAKAVPPPVEVLARQDAIERVESRIDDAVRFLAGKLADINSAIADAGHASRIDFRALTQLMLDLQKMCNHQADVLSTPLVHVFHDLEQFLRLQTETILHAIQQSHKQVVPRDHRY